MSIIKPVLHHVTIKTSKLDDMIDWYGLVTGSTVQFRDAFNAWTTNDAANHRIAFLSVPGLSDDPQKSSHTGMHHSAFEYDSFDDLMASFHRLAQADVQPAFCLDHGLTVSLYYQDPDGNYVELQADMFGDWKLSSDYMRTSPDFAANPIGHFFDAQKVHDAHASGTDVKTIRKGIVAGDFPPSVPPDLGMPAPEAPAA